MSPRTGRPPVENPKNIRLEIRLTQDESNILQECAERMNASKTDVINRGVQLVKAELDKK